MTVGEQNKVKMQCPGSKNRRKSSFVILLGILFLPVYFINSPQVRVFTLGVLSVKQKMLSLFPGAGEDKRLSYSPVKGSIVFRGASCRLWLLSR